MSVTIRRFALLAVLSLVAAISACKGGGNAAAGNATGHDTMPGMAGAPDTAPMPIDVPAAQRNRLGIVTVAAERRELTRDVRLVGRVTPAETAARTVTSKVDGFVDRLYVDFTGREVRAGEPLFDLYSPMLVAAQQELLLALRLRTSLGAGASLEAAQNADSLVAAGRRRLEYWDIGADQIAALERSGAVSRTMTLRAPVSGVVLEKNVVQGQAIMAAAPLFQIADLSVVWLEADVFESDLGAVRVGQRADATFDAYPGDVYVGRVAYVYPTVDPASRTGRVRIELHNHEGRLRPGMFGTVRIVAPLGVRAVVIPRQAALVTGERQLVFVEDSVGRYVPRFVTLGVETDSLVEVRQGLRAGERVVATATFLLDAESNLGAAVAGMAGMDMTSQGQGAKRPSGQARPADPARHQH